MREGAPGSAHSRPAHRSGSVARYDDNAARPAAPDGGPTAGADGRCRGDRGRASGDLLGKD